MNSEQSMSSNFASCTFFVHAHSSLLKKETSNEII
jgi:hypothetical protein